MRIPQAVPQVVPHVPDPDATVAHRPDAPSTVDVTGDYVLAPSTEPAANVRPFDLPTVRGYELTGVLGRGGMSVVYAARDPAFGREGIAGAACVARRGITLK